MSARPEARPAPVDRPLSPADRRLDWVRRHLESAVAEDFFAGWWRAHARRTLAGEREGGRASPRYLDALYAALLRAGP